MYKRNDYIDWDTYFISVAFLSAKRSKDPNCQVGSVIINKDNIIIGTGYNGFPKNINDNDNLLPWNKNDNNPINNKYPYVIHAEVNAILNKNQMNLNNCILYTTHYPCNECAKIIIQSGIKTIKYYNNKKNEASNILFNLANIICIKLELNINEIYLKFDK